MAELLPDSRMKQPGGSVRRPDGWWQPIFCANCGVSGGLVPEENMTYAFYLCPPCGEKYGAMAHFYMMPDDVFFQKVSEEQLDRYGRFLNPVELLRALEDADHPLAKLARDRFNIK